MMVLEIVAFLLGVLPGYLISSRNGDGMAILAGAVGTGLAVLFMTAILGWIGTLFPGTATTAGGLGLGFLFVDATGFASAVMGGVFSGFIAVVGTYFGVLHEKLVETFRDAFGGFMK